MKWLFSATGHGKGVVMVWVDLSSIILLRIIFESPMMDSFNSNDIAEHVQKYTDAIKKIHLEDVEVEEFRKVRNVDWLTNPKYHGIKKTHYWIKEACNDKVHCFIAMTVDRALTEVKPTNQKNKDCYKNKNLKGKNKKIKYIERKTFKCIQVMFLYITYAYTKIKTFI